MTPQSVYPFRRREREKRLDKLVKESMRVSLVVTADGRLVRFKR